MTYEKWAVGGAHTVCESWWLGNVHFGVAGQEAQPPTDLLRRTNVEICGGYEMGKQ